MTWLASVWNKVLIVVLLGNPWTFALTTAFCEDQSDAPSDWNCASFHIDQEKVSLCCPPGTTCDQGYCELTSTSTSLVSSSQTGTMSSDWYPPCFYPNGDIEPNDMPCSSQGGACCPGRWACLSNGLCYNAGRYERHTCTDQSWGSSCPQICNGQHGEHTLLVEHLACFNRQKVAVRMNLRLS